MRVSKRDAGKSPWIHSVLVTFSWAQNEDIQDNCFLCVLGEFRQLQSSSPANSVSSTTISASLCRAGNISYLHVWLRIIIAGNNNMIEKCCGEEDEDGASSTRIPPIKY